MYVRTCRYTELNIPLGQSTIKPSLREEKLGNNKKGRQRHNGKDIHLSCSTVNTYLWESEVHDTFLFAGQVLAMHKFNELIL